MIVHVAGAVQCSWYDLAREVVREAGLQCDVQPTTTAQMARPAPRPGYSVLGTERDTVAPRLPDWRQGLREYMSMSVSAI